MLRLGLLLVLLFTSAVATAAPIAGFNADRFGDEQSRTLWFEGDSVRAVVAAPQAFDANRPTLLIVFALPNGNTIEQTIGCRPAPGLDWHFDIQHVAAQVRRVRELDAARNVAVAYVEADALSWPAWRQKRPDAPRRITAIIDALAESLPGRPPTLALAAHSGGGAFVLSYLDAADAVPARVERIAFLDANYSFDTDKRHGTKLADWLRGGGRGIEDAERDRRHLVVVAYDDRNVTLNGKQIVSDTGGTWRASERMLASLSTVNPFERSADGDVVRHTGFGKRARFLLHANPETKILHTRLVELNGVVEALTLGTPSEGKWGGSFFGPRVYELLVQPVPAVPARRPTAAGGRALAERLGALPPDQREAAIAAEVLRGNIPPVLREPKRVTLRAEIDGQPHACEIYVMPDHLAVGGGDDFLRVPLTPATAVQVAAQLGCALPTRKMVDAIDAAADVRLDPRPLTEDREAFATFARHHTLIEAQRAGRPGLVTGTKKDVVVSNRLLEKPGRVAIYGWRKPDGQPIQPLTIVHKASYIDYSHGVRLVGRLVRVDGQERPIEAVLADPKLHVLLSDEGPVTEPAAFYR